MTGIPDKIRSKIIGQTVNLVRYEASLQADVVAMLDELGADLVRGLMGAGLDTPRTDWQRARLQAMLKEAKATIGSALADMGEWHSQEMAGLVQVSGKGITTAMNEAIGADLMLPPQWTREQLRAIASDVLIDGAPSAAWWDRQAVDLLEDFSDSMRKGMLRGENITQLRNRIMGQDLPGVNAVGKIDLRTVPVLDRAVIKKARANAEALVRTSVIATANTAHLETFRANSDILEGMEWLSTLDSKTTPICRALDGLKWELDGTPIGHSQPYPGATAHWNCFVPGTMVQSPNILRGFGRPYSGDVVVIRTAGGNEVTCTPNHPILTDHGWVAAGDLEEGHKVICRSRLNWAAGSAPNGVEVETRIEDVVTSLLGSRGMVPMTVPLAAKDFHGDAFNHQVATVWANRELGDNLEPSSLEHSDELTLKNRSAGGHSSLPSNGGKRHFTERSGSALHGFMGLLGEAHSFFWASICHADEHGIAAATYGDACSLEPILDDASASIKPSSQCLNADPRTIERREFINVKGNSHGCIKAMRLEGGRNDIEGYTEISVNCVGPHPGFEGVDDRLIVNRNSSFGSVDMKPVITKHFGDALGSSRVGTGDLGDRFATAITGANNCGINRAELGSDLDAIHAQEFSDEMAVGAKFASDLISGNPFYVCLEDVISVNSQFFDGHVYNLETEGNWYVANGIITHNCRSTTMPVTKSWETLAREAHGNSTIAKELDRIPTGQRASMGGPVSGDLTYKQWFDAQPEAQQAEYLGRGELGEKRLALYKKGGLDFTEMLNQKGNQLSLKGLRALVG